jgi:hypothetical protein
MSKRRNLERKRKEKLKRHATAIISKLSQEQQDRLAEALAKAVTNAGLSDSTATETTGQ